MTEVLNVSNLYKNFGKLCALENVSISVKKGEVFGIIGPSGSGKSTLLRCINCLERADKGSIWIEGTYLAQNTPNGSVYLDDEKLRHARLKLGLVFQNFNLFPHLNVLDNLILAPTLADNIPQTEAKDFAYSLLEKVGLTKKAKNYPFELSGGQSQRVAIARALAMKPDILCFDEPTSALDPELTGEVLKVIRQLSQDNMTMIIVTHEMNFAREIAHMVAFMDEAQIIITGTPNDVMQNSDNERIRSFLNQIERD